MSLALKMLKVALAEAGVEEHPRGSNRGPRVDDYQRATWLEPKDWGAWCAAFVCFCMKTAMELPHEKPYTFSRMRTGSVRGASGIAAWSCRQDKSTHTKMSPGRDLLPGDIITFRDFSHTAIVASGVDPDGHFDTVEGNTNDDGGREGYEVVHRKSPHKRRSINQVECRVRILV